MRTPAVTEDASAASTAASSIEQALESGFLPDDPHYRMTGEFPEEKKDEKKDEKKETPDPNDTKDPSVNDDASAASEADTAAASAAAEAQEKKDKGPAQSKTDKTSESRWAKITRENKELREKNERLERERTAAPPRDTKQPSQAAADANKATAAAPKPKIDDVDSKTGKAKYATYDEFQDARDEWNRKEAVREFTETSAKTQRETAFTQAKQTIAREFGKKVEVAKTKHADFEAVALNPDLPIKEGSPVDLFTLDSPIGTDVLYHLGQNPAELDRINKLNPLAQVRELTKIELKLSETKAPVRQITAAARPPNQVSGKGTVAKDSVVQAVEDQDQDTYNREQNARALARRRGK